MASRVDSSALSVASEEKASARKHHDPLADHDSANIHKIRSAYGGGNKKKMHPLLLGPGRQSQGKLISLHAASKNNLSEFTQRIMSAKLLRVKQVQNQLTETQLQLNELINENRILRNMQKRQEGALRRYEGNHAELPQLIRSHNEEIRTLKASNKLIKAQLRESNSKLKDRENELEALRDNYNRLKKLSTEKNLLEREKLQKKVEDLQEVVKEQEEKIQVLSRKILLESKNYRHHLNVEILKHKETQKDLTSALTTINKLESQLFAKDRLPGGKILLKRESKAVMPIISNKSTEIQTKMGISEDSILSHDERRRKSRLSTSPDSELELLNVGVSSEDTQSPMQDIFPDINITKKSNFEIEKTTETCFSRSDVYEFDCESTKKINSSTFKKVSIPIKSSRFSSEVEENAKVLTEKLTENIATIDSLVQKVEKNSGGGDNITRLNLLYEEMKNSASKLESEACDISLESDKQEKDSEENCVKTSEREGRRSVPKRKFEDNQTKETAKSSADFKEELSGAEKQKLASMTKTWNELKDKIQEERKKAEKKMKELSTLNGAKSVSDYVSSDSDLEQPEVPSMPVELADKKELNFVNFTDDAYILEELQKTDKIFNKLKSETKKSYQRGGSLSLTNTDKNSKVDNAEKTTPKIKPKPKPRQQDIKSFRTESRRNPKYLEEFQSECQKQNLIKALKAIDNEKDPGFSTEESGDSETETKKGKFNAKNGLKNVRKLSSDKDFLTELFGSRQEFEKTENVAFEYGTVTEVNE